MSERPTVSVPAGIEEAQLQFEAWRRERKRGQRIPESLWATAVELAKQWGVWPTARALHLDHNRLKRRVRNGQDSEKSSAFVELISEGAMLCACRVEMEDGRGARMRRRHGVEPDVLERARMIAVSAQTRIWVARAPADFRCGIDGLSILNSDAAGIDIGAMEIYVAVPPDRDPEPVRMFATFTEDLNALADWLQQCGVGTVAMESTGVYWVPLVQILETRGFETYLVNAKHAKNVPGRQTDVSDCQWLRHLHSVGLLRASFRPAQHVCAIRSLTRHRDNLIEMATCHVQHMQKALDQMNLQLHHVISDITGTTGLAILDAILAGERDAKKLADLRDPRIRATHETIAKSLVGDFRPEHLFTLRQSLALYRHYQMQIVECEKEIQQMMKSLETKADLSKPLPLPKDSIKKCKVMKPERAVALHEQAYRILGVDLTTIPGISVLHVQAIVSEIGSDLSKFRSAAAFSSWMGLCPHNDISGGRILWSGTRKVKNRIARTLRMAAQSLQHNQSALADFYRRMRAKLGPPKAITATAHKLARIVYHLITKREAYDDSVFVKAEEKYQQRMKNRLNAQAKALGFTLVPSAI